MHSSERVDVCRNRQSFVDDLSSTVDAVFVDARRRFPSTVLDKSSTKGCTRTKAHHRIFRPPFCQSSKQVIFRIFPKIREWCLQTPSNKVHCPDIGRGGVPRPYRALVPPLGHKTCPLFRACTPKPNVAKPFLCAHTAWRKETVKIESQCQTECNARTGMYSQRSPKDNARACDNMAAIFHQKNICSRNRHVATNKTKNK